MNECPRTEQTIVSRSQSNLRVRCIDLVDC
jgi:hypothetical protein